MKAPSQHNFVVWFTGLSGAGKTTLAQELKKQLDLDGSNVYVLDGDVLRGGLNLDLGFSASDRSENIRRAAEVAKLWVDEGFCVLATFISPFQADRQKARDIIGAHRFKEVYIRCPLEICETRDVKGLYEKARAGLIRNFTGIDSPYEPPIQADVIISSDKQSINESVNHLLKSLFYTER
ncbi:MAG: adenylyl-sulfate kinase [Cyclobacteriaceae bacterium]|nr:adenylyl-sulfate kinase [Cyclobacteriaceae bacterium]